jgi:transposase
MNRRRRLTKVIWFDGSGWCILAKRLERGSFELPKVCGNETQVAIDGAAFASLLAGIDYTTARDGWYRRAAAR